MESVKLVKSKDEVDEIIAEEIREGESVGKLEVSNEEELDIFRGEYLDWVSRVDLALRNSFSRAKFGMKSPAGDFGQSALKLFDLMFDQSSWEIERVPQVKADVKDKLRVLKNLRKQLDIYAPSAPPVQGQVVPADAPIFLVHGRDEARRETVRRFLEKATNRKVTVLADEPNRGEDILGKLLYNAQQSAFAVVILTPDDVGGLAGGAMNSRARQNVIFELGLFIGLLGRKSVAALYESGVETPTDYDGVAYISLDGDGWKMSIVQELLSAGIDASMDRAMGNR